ncbi:MAG: flagellar export chaperone FlgN [Solirubrobacteraceae bacterium]
MSTLAPAPHLAAPGQRTLSGDELLAADLLAHLAAQIGSAERLLEIVISQGAAIRRRDVHEVVRLAGMLQAEMSRRQQIEAERSDLLARSGLRLGVPPEAVSISRLSAMLPSQSAAQAVSRSAQLTGMLHELQREHLLNRALMKVELSFLDYLMKTLSLDANHIYDATGAGGSSARTDPTAGMRVLDLEA